MQDLNTRLFVSGIDMDRSNADFGVRCRNYGALSLLEAALG